ncbi:MAG: hypothetical protein JXL20_05520 [Deltaproteobacteria bacterium]|nr:hypothetical protein [Deltaproteobacteria bacterium]MBN2783799.1 hypothetical protein [Pontiellaceae bacterium]
MDTKSASILGACIIIASTILASSSRKQPDPADTQNIGRFQISNPGEKGMAFVIDTVTGRVWVDPVSMSGGTDGVRFYNRKLNDASTLIDVQ